MMPKNSKLLGNARKLRREMTRQERHLWYDFLQHYPVKIYKQRIIGNYIVDFYCHRARLVIELDGSQHYEDTSVKYDKNRTDFLNSLGIDVLRILNIDIDRNFKSVCIMIDHLINEKVNTNDKIL
ncbi:MAG: endonuclease domain-containing protein [Clostridia bacterium]|nr:endonuclease domain-containing protein [Clostridia bacterium]